LSNCNCTRLGENMMKTKTKKNTTTNSTSLRFALLGYGCRWASKTRQGWWCRGYVIRPSRDVDISTQTADFSQANVDGKSSQRRSISCH
jgi:hypothetical protein